MPSIAVIVLDTLRYDTFLEHFDWLDGLQFTNAWSTSHWTGSAHASLFTGHYPTEVGTTVKSRSIDSDYPMISEVLSEAGYHTRIATTNLQIFVWDGWERGFDERYGPNIQNVNPVPEDVVDWSEFNSATNWSGIAKYASAIAHCFYPRYNTVRSLREGYKLVKGNNSSIAAVQNRVESLDIYDDDFLLANIMDMHAPYHPPSDYQTVDRKVNPEFENGVASDIKVRDEIQTAYNDCAKYLSDKYREFHASLLADYDYVITLSDHGELLGEHGLWTHTYGLYPELTHIPLVISGHDIRNEVVKKPVSLVDVHATIADIADVKIDSRGESLLDDISSDTHLVEYHGLSEGRREKFSNQGISQYFESYNQPLDGIIGPHGYAFETQDDLQVKGEWSINEAEYSIESIIGSIDRKPIQSDQTNTPDSIQRRLEALGYA